MHGAGPALGGVDAGLSVLDSPEGLFGLVGFFGFVKLAIRFFELLTRLVYLNFIGRFCLFSQNTNVIVGDFDKATANRKDMLAATAAFERQDTRIEGAHQRRMAGQNAQIAVGSRYFGQSHLLIDEQTLRGRDFELERVGHYPFIFSAASSTSSILPCM